MSHPAPNAGPPDSRAFIGRQFADKFRLDECIGQSNDALVFKAEQVNLRRDVAVKVLLADPGGDWQLGARLRREARLIAALRHPGIGEVYDEGVTPEGLPFIVMELLRGRTLARHLDDRGKLPPPEAVEIVRAVADVLAFVHGAGYVHRDLKPSNIFLVERVPGAPPTVKVIDFGAIRRVDARFEDDPVARRTLRGLRDPTMIKTIPGFVIGTPNYMSPEQCSCGEIDARSDVYSLGVVLYELLAGRCPFRGGTGTAIMASHLAVSPPSLTSLGIRVQPGLERAVLRTLEKDPWARFQSMEEFARALVAGGAESSSGPVLAPPPPPPPAVSVPTVRPKRVVASDPPPEIPTTGWSFTAMAVVAAVACAAAVAFWLVRGRLGQASRSTPPRAAAEQVSSMPALGSAAEPAEPVVDVATAPSTAPEGPTAPTAERIVRVQPAAEGSVVTSVAPAVSAPGPRRGRPAAPAPRRNPAGAVLDDLKHPTLRRDIPR